MPAQCPTCLWPGAPLLVSIAARFIPLPTCRFGRLLECLRAPLARRGPAMGELVGFDFGSWLELAERHNLPALKSYCLVRWLAGRGGCWSRDYARQAVSITAQQRACCMHGANSPGKLPLAVPGQECLMHLLVAPGSSGRSDEPSVSQIDWQALRRGPRCLCKPVGCHRSCPSSNACVSASVWPSPTHPPSAVGRRAFHPLALHHPLQQAAPAVPAGRLGLRCAALHAAYLHSARPSAL